MSSSLRIATLLCTCIALCLAGPAAAETVTAALQIEAGAGASPDQAAIVTGEMEKILLAGKKLKLVERANIAKVMKEQALAQSGMMSDEVQLKVAALLSARFLVVGSVLAEESGFRLTAKALDANSSTVAFSDSVRAFSADELAKAGRQLARLLQDTLAGGSSAKDNGESLGEFDVDKVKKGARELAYRLAARFPTIKGKLKEVLPNNSTSCTLSDPRSAFSNQRFKVSFMNDMTSQLEDKGIFLLKTVDEKGGCGGKVKADGGEPIVDGDTITSMPLKVSMAPLEVGSGTDPELGKVFSLEARESLKNQGAFVVSDDDPQVRLVGRMSGTTAAASIEIQALEKGGAMIQRWDLQGNFSRPAKPVVRYVPPTR